MRHDALDGQIFSFESQTPVVDPTAWVAPGARLVGNVHVGPEVGVYFNAVLRAEGASIRVGARSNVQDNCVVHAGLEYEVTIGSGVVVGHSAIIHGCEVQDDVLVGMGAILLNDCVVGRGSLVGAGTLVGEGVTIPPGSLVVGNPGRAVRQLTEVEQQEIRSGADHYVGLLRGHGTGSDGAG